MGAVKNHYHDELLARWDYAHDEPDECECCGRLFLGMSDSVCGACTELNTQEVDRDQAH